jgi:uncharacterized repeat protein (TIGR01451 family)
VPFPGGVQVPGSLAIPGGVPLQPVQGPSAPQVTLAVRVPASVGEGQDIAYRIVVQNPSSSSAHHVTVRNPLPGNASFVSANPVPQVRQPELVWRLGTLQPGATQEITLVLKPTGGDVSDCARVSFEHGQCVTTRIARPALSIRKIAPDRVNLYDPVRFRLEIHNTGATPINDVVVTDILPKELRYDRSSRAPGSNTDSDRRVLLTWNLGTLAPGQTEVITYDALTREEGTFTNRAVVSAGNLRHEASARIVVGRAKLGLTMSGPATGYTNLPVVYEITAANPGSGTAVNVNITNPLPANARFISASDGGTLAGNEVRWSLGSLAPGAKRTVQLQLSAAAAGEIRNIASVRADGDLTASAEAVTKFAGIAGLSAQLRAKTNPLAVRQEGAYELVIRTVGNDDAKDVKVKALVPSQLQATDAEGPVKAELKAGEVIFGPVTIKPGKEVVYTIYAKALKTGDVRFAVEIESAALPAGPLRLEASTTIFDENGGGTPPGAPPE